MPNWIVNNLKLVGEEKEVKDFIDNEKWFNKRRNRTDSISFETPWKAPLNGIMELSKKYPELCFHISSYDDLDSPNFSMVYEYTFTLYISDTYVYKNGKLLVCIIPQITHYNLKEEGISNEIEMEEIDNFVF